MKATAAEAADRIIGCTRFFNLDRANKSVELGHTWIAPAFQGTRANTEAKFLQLSYAFDELLLNRVSFKTHHENRALAGSHQGNRRRCMKAPSAFTSSCPTAVAAIAASSASSSRNGPDVKDLLSRRLNAPL